MAAYLEDPRRQLPAFVLTDRPMLEGWLDFQRATLAIKCEGLTDDQLRERAVPPSTLSLLGLVRHMAEVERNWFRPVLGGEPMSLIFAPDMDWDASFRDVDTADIKEAFEAWQAECDNARELVAAAPNLDVQGFRRSGYVSLRWVLTHMIEEYARHNGHADFLRELVDGGVGF